MRRASRPAICLKTTVWPSPSVHGDDILLIQLGRSLVHGVQVLAALVADIAHQIP